MYYTYITIVRHPKLGNLYYVGMGSKSNYHGSSRYKHWNKWLHEHPEWFQTRIVKYFHSLKECCRAESDLIFKYLTKHGAFQQGSYTTDGKRMSWLDQFGPGTCLNGHWGDCSHMYESIKQSQNHKEAAKRNLQLAFKKLHDTGKTEAQKEASRVALKKAVSVAYAKKSIGILSPSQLDQCRRTIQIARRAQSRKYSCDGFVGTLPECCEHFGITLWKAKKLAVGGSDVTICGYTFKRI